LLFKRFPVITLKAIHYDVPYNAILFKNSHQSSFSFVSKIYFTDPEASPGKIFPKQVDFLLIIRQYLNEELQASTR
jgi:hypothetical protein